MPEKLKSVSARSKQLEIEFFKKEPVSLKKDNVPAPPQKKVSFLSNVWKVISAPIHVMSGSFLITLFLNYSGVVDFQTILSKIGTERFNSALLLFLALYMAGKMLGSIMQTNDEKMEINYTSIWGPLQTAVLMSLFIPYNNGPSPFSNMLASMIHVWINTLH